MRLLAVLLVLAACGDDEPQSEGADPALSPACIKARMKYIETKYQIDQGAELGADASLVAMKRMQLDQFMSANWQCFK